ncbi:MAG: RNA methyltransferase [Firmicutes bacterium]|nr:RNA methyltransferase [Bacillota bacterium]
MILNRIASRDNGYLKLARSLAQKKYRQQHGAFLIEGIRLAEEALDADVGIRFALTTGAAAAGGRSGRAVAACLERGVSCFETEEALLAQISDTQHSQGLLMVADCPLPLSQADQVPAGGCLLVLDRLADPGNVGSVIRSAYAAGIGAVLLNAGCADIYNPKTVRSAMGALFKLPVLSMADEQILALLRRQERRIAVAAAEGTDLFAGPPLRAPLAWVLGSEAAGASEFWRRQADVLLGLPMREGAESLNVAAAAAVIIYESRRQGAV